MIDITVGAQFIAPGYSGCEQAGRDESGRDESRPYGDVVGDLVRVKV